MIQGAQSRCSGWGGDGRGMGFKREGIYVYPWPVHGDVWQKASQYCKAIILQLNNNKK